MSETDSTASVAPQILEQDSYQILKNRLNKQGDLLSSKLQKLNEARKETFGSIETKLLANERITTANNCLARDMVAIGNFFIFGYNVHLGLRSDITVADVFSLYSLRDGSFHSEKNELLKDERFEEDFRNLYKYYKHTQFAKFARIGPYLYLVFRVSKNTTDIKTFKWRISDDSLSYIDNRSEHEFVYPDQHQFSWKRVNRDMHRSGKHPHISIDDRVFVETITGTLTIKIEDNTESGSGIYEEPVDFSDQTLDDAEIHYALLNHLIVLRIRPYQEEDYRFIVYNEKIHEALRIDALEDACVLLPDDHGIIFPKGYYLQTGKSKLFDYNQQNMEFEKKIASPNGEDFLYVFYNRKEGLYVLLSYNIISQDVATPIFCHGYSLFHEGELLYFKSDHEQKKHHAVQIWQTPFYHADFEPTTAQGDQLIAKIGNKEIVRGMAECHEILSLIQKEDSYNDLYVDLVKKSSDILDSYYWLDNPDTHLLAEPLQEIKNTATSALEEFEKVQRIRENNRKQVALVGDKIKKVKSDQVKGKKDAVDHYVRFLAEYRKLRGEIIALRDLRYVDEKIIDGYEKHAQEQSEILSQKCIEFLLQESALAPYEAKINELLENLPKIEKVVAAEELGKEVDQISSELELLIEIVSNLKIADATQTTQIIDNISSLYSRFNTFKSQLKKKRKDLLAVEGTAEFHAQVNLLDQGLINYMDLADNPQKCEDYLTKMMVQIEELESKFIDFNEFISILTEKREEIYTAFEGKKVNLIERQNQRANSLKTSAERMLKGIRNRLDGFSTIIEINGYIAGDLMVDKVRDIIQELKDMGDSVKADTLESQLKTTKEDALRQLKDKADLFSEKGDTIQFGKHAFSVNNQNLDLTSVLRDNALYYHLTGTNFFEKIIDSVLEESQEVWMQGLVSENSSTYRAEFLAYELFSLAQSQPNEQLLKDWASLTLDELKLQIRKEMNSRFSEGYTKGIHDHDTGLLLSALIQLHQTSDFLKFRSQARACAALFWNSFLSEERKSIWQKRVKAAGLLWQVFPNSKERQAQQKELEVALFKFIKQTNLFDEEIAEEAAEYLFLEQARDAHFVIDADAAKLYLDFESYLKTYKHKQTFELSVKKLQEDPIAKYRLIRHWLEAFMELNPSNYSTEILDECSQLIFSKGYQSQYVISTPMHVEIEGLQGEHSQIKDGKYYLNYNAFLTKLKQYKKSVVPLYKAFQARKHHLIDTFKQDIRLEEFKPRIMSSFVRNQLIDEVYLPLIGDNLAKQIGTADANKRTDRMGMLLLLSPPGYGKTTLMEYIANRLGIIFMKINGPAIGHQVTSIDPSEAKNGAARQELERLNLAFEMGDNVMIYLDDIQHCNPEFLQKFISLCDGTRKIEGVYKGRTRTYDLRGKKVAVVMAGNPYTESGDKFQIPDMLANRADIYNLGDIIGDGDRAFKMSYIENALTSNAVLAKLASKSFEDVYALLKVARTDSQEGIDYKAKHSAEEINEYVNILKKLIRIREVVFDVNQQYIASAAQNDDYRTEPPFKLQGSYRNMNKLAERVSPIMNDSELASLILSHYENESQTLTHHAEANLLKFKEILQILSPEESTRWEAIKSTFAANNQSDKEGKNLHLSKLLGQMSSVIQGLDGIETALNQDKYFLKVKNVKERDTGE